MVKVRLQGRKAPITVHCSGSLPNLLRAALALAEKVAAILGGAAVAEGRRRADAERESAAATASAHTRPSSDQPGQPVSFFEKSRQIQQFEAEKKRAEARVREADGHLRSARLLVLAEQKAVVQAEEQLSTVQAAADAASGTLLKAKADAAEICAELEKLRAKRQRLDGEAAASTDAAAAEAAASQAPAADGEAPLDFESYLDYSLETFKRLEADEVRRRGIVPKRGNPKKRPRMGKVGALQHWRRGLIGAVQSWANGSMENVIMLIMHLIEHFNISAEIYKQLQKSSGVRHPCSQDPCLPAPQPPPADCCGLQVLLLARSTRTSWRGSWLRCTLRRPAARRRSEESTTCCCELWHLCS